MSVEVTLEDNKSAESLAHNWAKKFNSAIETMDVVGLGELFAGDSHWRDLLALTWRIETQSGRQSLQEKILASAKSQEMKNFKLDERRSAPKLVERAGQYCIEAFASFDTNVGKCVSVFRLLPDGQTAWTFMSALSEA